MTRMTSDTESTMVRSASIPCERCGADETSTVEVHTMLDGALTRTDFYCTECTETFPVWW